MAAVVVGQYLLAQSAQAAQVAQVAVVLDK
jgi:hypothetical protein